VTGDGFITRPSLEKSSVDLRSLLYHKPVIIKYRDTKVRIIFTKLGYLEAGQAAEKQLVADRQRIQLETSCHRFSLLKHGWPAQL
jgi:hypothetical protein